MSHTGLGKSLGLFSREGMAGVLAPRAHKPLSFEQKDVSVSLAKTKGRRIT